MDCLWGACKKESYSLYYKCSLDKHPMNIPKSFGLKVCGIYAITNSLTHKLYIGSSKNIYHRLKRHYSELKRNRHANPHLQNSFNKYGAKSFEVSILEVIPENLLCAKEQEYIDNFKPAYNITTEVIRNTPSIESRLKISNTLKKQKEAGLLKYPTHDDRKKPVVIYTKTCECIGYFESERDAAKMLKLYYPAMKYPQSIVNQIVNGKCLKSKRKRYKDFLLLRPNEQCVHDSFFKVSSWVEIKVVNIETNEEFTFESLARAARYFKCHTTTITRAIKSSNLLQQKFKIMKS